MAHTGVFATSDEVLVRAGENYDTSITEARINDLCAQSESLINVLTRYNWSDAYSGLNADVKRILSETSACLAANAIIAYNLDSYPSRTEAEDMININRDIALRNLSVLRDKKNQDFMTGA